MNSKQRRKIKREFPHIIIMRARNNERYFYHDGRASDAVVWCKHNTKGHMSCMYWDYAEFKFKHEKDAIVFALKWL